MRTPRFSRRFAMSRRRAANPGARVPRCLFFGRSLHACRQKAKIAAASRGAPVDSAGRDTKITGIAEGASDDDIL